MRWASARLQKRPTDLGIFISCAQHVFPRHRQAGRRRTGAVMTAVMTGAATGGNQDQICRLTLTALRGILWILFGVNEHFGAHLPFSPHEPHVPCISRLEPRPQPRLSLQGETLQRFHGGLRSYLCLKRCSFQHAVQHHRCYSRRHALQHLRVHAGRHLIINSQHHACATKPSCERLGHPRCRSEHTAILVA